MEFDTADFLTGLFAAPVVSGSDAVRQEPTPGPATDDAPAASPFTDWVRRRDVTGRWGWEAPAVPKADRWWARFRFEDLPELLVAPGTARSLATVPQGRDGCSPRGPADTFYT